MTREELLAVAEPRWRALRERRVDLGGAIDMQRVLVTRGLDLGAALDRQPLPVAPRPAGALAARLAGGDPVGLDEGVEVDAALLGPYLLGFCDDLAAGGAGAPARHLREVLERGEIDVGSLLAASLGRRQAAIRTRAAHVGVSPDLTWVVAEMAVGPLACRLRRHVLAAADPDPEWAAAGAVSELAAGAYSELAAADADSKLAAADADSELAAAVRGWGRGYCPACGSWPALAELGHGNPRGGAAANVDANADGDGVDGGADAREGADAEAGARGRADADTGAVAGGADARAGAGGADARPGTGGAGARPGTGGADPGPGAGGGADGGRRLRCSFCGAGWPFAPGACIYCGAGGEGLLTAAGASEAQRAELCRSCGGYLKCIAGGAPTPFELLPVIDLETSELDVGAMQRGYGRPSMRETDAPAPPCPPS